MLNKEDIKKIIKSGSLVQNYIDQDKQLTPNGFDLTVGNIFRFDSQGSLDFSNSERIVPECSEIKPKKKSSEDKFGWWHLEKGAYKVKTNEIVNLPNNLIALAFSRTSLLRMGAFTQNGVWDVGFEGKGEFILVVENVKGLSLKENARIIQLVFFSVGETEAYDGIYKGLK